MTSDRERGWSRLHPLWTLMMMMMWVKWAEVTSRDSSSPVDVLSAVWRVGKGYSSGVIHRWAALTVGPVWKCHGLMGTGRLRQGQRALNPLWTGVLSEDSMTCFWFNLFYLIVLWMSAPIFLILVAQPFILFPSIRIINIKLFEMKLPHLLQLLVNDACKQPDLGLSWFEKFSGCLIFPTLDVCQHQNPLFLSLTTAAAILKECLLGNSDCCIFGLDDGKRTFRWVTWWSDSLPSSWMQRLAWKSSLF